MGIFPRNTKVAVKMTALIRHKEKIVLHERMSTRMVKCASVMPRGEFIGWDLYVPPKGLAEMNLFGSESLCESDLTWILEHVSACKRRKTDNKERKNQNNRLYELVLPNMQNGQETCIGFEAALSDADQETNSKWPERYSAQFMELIKAFQNTGAQFRAVIGSADEKECAKCRKDLIRSWGYKDYLDEYIGRPVKGRFLLRIPGEPTIRLKTVMEEAIPGVSLCRIGSKSEERCIGLWENPLADAQVFPDYAARILLMEPEVDDSMIGIELCEDMMKPIPFSHKNPNVGKNITIGKATATTGVKSNIRIADVDLRRHYQIVGQTGTGKSTLLSTIILSAIEQGNGLSFFDPHGSTIDELLRCIPAEHMDRVRVVRIGDADHPVPLNIWDSDDFEKEERTISDLCELFADIFDPKQDGIVGPRYERWLSTFCKAAIAFFGRKASFESIAIISQSQDNMLKLCRAILPKYPDLVNTIKEEYGLDKSNDFHNYLNWYLCKFQRLTSVEQLRKTLGAGTNALNFNQSIDTDTVTLIDLASPVIGSHAARIVGIMVLMKLWNAAMARKERDKTHIVAVDEAALFQTNPMPRMLAEARKFGLSMVLCHQHTGQLTAEIRDALEANSANFSSFRLSPRDAANASIRFDNPELLSGLTRLDAFQAITSLSVNGRQTAPFTLETIKPKRQKNGEAIAKAIEENSIRKLVEPYEAERALSKREIQNYLNGGTRMNRTIHPIEKQDDTREAEPKMPDPKWLSDWKEKKAS